MVALADHGLNGILADEMGLGKTVQVSRAVHPAPPLGGSNPSQYIAESSVIKSPQSHKYPWGKVGAAWRILWTQYCISRIVPSSSEHKSRQLACKKRNMLC